MVAAFALVNVTGARGGYAVVLLHGLAFAAAGDAWFIVACWRAMTAWRVAALIASLPTVLVLEEFVRRWEGART